MITNIVIFLMKYLLLSAALYGVYMLLFKERASFKACRIYLLLLPLLSAGGALLSFDVVKIADDEPIGRVISTFHNVGEQLSGDNEDNLGENVVNYVDGGVSIFELKSYDQTKEAPFVPLTFYERNRENIIPISLFSLWFLVALYYFIVYIVSAYKINKIISNSQLERGKNEVNVYINEEIESPFSYKRNILVNGSSVGEKLDLILRHEMAHIENHHYIDKQIIQIYTTLLWFNPIITKVANEICTVHEFEADCAVVASKCDIKSYKLFIFEESCGYTPQISSGFNSSLTKQRFMQMKNNYKIKSKFARKLLTLPLVVSLLALTSFTYLNESELKTLKDNMEADDEVVATRKKFHYIAKNEQFGVVKSDDFDGNLFKVYRYKDRTEVDILSYMSTKKRWVSLASDSYIEDTETGDRYIVHSLKNNLPLDREIDFYKDGDSDFWVSITAVFPPLKKNVTMVNFTEAYPKWAKTLNGFSLWKEFDIPVNIDARNPASVRVQE